MTEDKSYVLSVAHQKPSLANYSTEQYVQKTAALSSGTSYLTRTTRRTAKKRLVITILQNNSAWALVKQRYASDGCPKDCPQMREYSD
jgi:hypothetical protein